MENGSARPQNLIETTDALEAVSACQSMKNVFFTLILIGLIFCQIVFWLNHFGLIAKNVCNPCKIESAAAGKCAKGVCTPVFLAATMDKVGQVEPAAVDSQAAQAVQPPADKVESAGPTKPEDPQTTASVPAQEQVEKSGKVGLKEKIALFHISCRFAKGLVAVCNFVILAGAILYSLSLLMCVKISLAGRLGGINHSVRAFFISLLLLVMLIPWQVILPKAMLGAVWLPGELLCGGWCRADGVVLWKVMLYLRFCGLWLVAVWLLLWTQIRSAKWARATLRRLGLAR
ncbi:MAG: hypothetical protein L0Y36_02935 [Planctomycetales bacterium]|nr:hypothetical protein [Planctomycetales bacterium]